MSQFTRILSWKMRFLLRNTVFKKANFCAASKDFLPVSCSGVPSRSFKWMLRGSGHGQILCCARTFASDSENKSSEKKLTDSKIQDKLLDEVAEYYSQYEDEYYEIDEDQEEWVVPAEETFPVSLERGKTGVFDKEDLVELLRQEKAVDICCLSVPREAAYGDYLVICSAFSVRHLNALAERVNKVFKRRKNSEDPAVYLEGRKDPNWRVLDMGNIVLHIMMPEAREMYDIEQLWAVGAEFDSLVSVAAGKETVSRAIEEWIRETTEQQRKKLSNEQSDAKEKEKVPLADCEVQPMWG